jgi:hypothetical protein
LGVITLVAVASQYLLIPAILLMAYVLALRRLYLKVAINARRLETIGKKEEQWYHSQGSSSSPVIIIRIQESCFQISWKY